MKKRAWSSWPKVWLIMVSPQYMVAVYPFFLILSNFKFLFLPDLYILWGLGLPLIGLYTSSTYHRRWWGVDTQKILNEHVHMVMKVRKAGAHGDSRPSYTRQWLIIPKTSVNSWQCRTSPSLIFLCRALWQRDDLLRGRWQDNLHCFLRLFVCLKKSTLCINSLGNHISVK